MRILLLILLFVVMAGAVYVLVRGVIGMASGKDMSGEQSQKWMQRRVLLQAVAMAEQLQPGRRFIRAGGAGGAAHLHLARTIVRRAERSTVAASRHVPLNPLARIYLNRLTDHLFVLARSVVSAQGGDVLWQ